MTNPAGIVLSLLLWVLPAVGFAEEPPVAVPQAFAGNAYAWKLEENGKLTVTATDDGGAVPRGQYDLSLCFFCSGEGDNCDSDGIVEVTLPGEPVLAVTCHVGAHSQMLQILAPLRNPSEAVYSVSGAYYVIPDVTTNGVTVTYDARQGDGSFIEKTGTWP